MGYQGSYGRAIPAQGGGARAATRGRASRIIIAMDWHGCGDAYVHGHKQHIVQEVKRLSHSRRAMLTCLSVAQDHTTDQRYVHKKAISKSNTAFRQLPKLVQDAGVELYRGLMVDIEHNMPRGTCWSASDGVGEKYWREGHMAKRYVPDYSKVSMVYAQAHEVVAKIQSEDQRPLAFDFHVYDDVPDILSCIKSFFAANAALLPRGLRLHLHKIKYDVDSFIVSDLSGPIIVGSGDIDFNVRANLHSLYAAFLASYHPQDRRLKRMRSICKQEAMDPDFRLLMINTTRKLFSASKKSGRSVATIKANAARFALQWRRRKLAGSTPPQFGLANPCYLPVRRPRPKPGPSPLRREVMIHHPVSPEQPPPKETAEPQPSDNLSINRSARADLDQDAYVEPGNQAKQQPSATVGEAGSGSYCWFLRFICCLNIEAEGPEKKQSVVGQ